jgi:hypothetical protein
MVIKGYLNHIFLLGKRLYKQMRTNFFFFLLALDKT